MMVKVSNHLPEIFSSSLKASDINLKGVVLNGVENYVDGTIAHFKKAN